jgi:hypothetical protein
MAWNRSRGDNSAKVSLGHNSWSLLSSSAIDCDHGKFATAFRVEVVLPMLGDRTVSVIVDAVAIVVVDCVTFCPSSWLSPLSTLHNRITARSLCVRSVHPDDSRNDNDSDAAILVVLRIDSSGGGGSSATTGIPTQANATQSPQRQMPTRTTRNRLACCCFVVVARGRPRRLNRRIRERIVQWFLFNTESSQFPLALFDQKATDCCFSIESWSHF